MTTTSQSVVPATVRNAFEFVRENHMLEAHDATSFFSSIVDEAISPDQLDKALDETFNEQPAEVIHVTKAFVVVGANDKMCDYIDKKRFADLHRKKMQEGGYPVVINTPVDRELSAIIPDSVTKILESMEFKPIPDKTIRHVPYLKLLHFDPRAEKGCTVQVIEDNSMTIDTDAPVAEVMILNNRRHSEDVPSAIESLINTIADQRCEDLADKPLHQIVTGTLSEPRVIGHNPEPVKELSEYEARRLGGEREIVGLIYPAHKSWNEEQSILDYLKVFSELPEREIESESQSTIYKTMFIKLKQHLWVDGKVDKAFSKVLEDAGYRVHHSPKTHDLRVEVRGDWLIWNV